MAEERWANTALRPHWLLWHDNKQPKKQRQYCLPSLPFAIVLWTSI